MRFATSHHRLRDLAPQATELTLQIRPCSALSTLGCDAGLERLEHAHEPGSIGRPPLGIALVGPFGQVAMSAPTVAPLAGGDLVLDPGRAALEAGHDVLGRGRDEARVDLAPAPHTRRAVAVENHLESTTSSRFAHPAMMASMSVEEPEHEGAAHWFEELADHMGPAYLRYSFTKGTAKEIDELLRRVSLDPGARILDVGCGPGRHAHELGRRGFEVLGVDISETFVDVARADAPSAVTFERLDARTMTFDAEFDLVLSVCQGAFGMSGGPAAGPALDPDAEILDGMARAVRPGGFVVFTAFNAYLQVANLVEGNDFDAARGVHRETTEVRDSAGVPAEVDLWTTCFTPRELRLLCASAGLTVESIDAAEPGDWAPRPPDTDSPEFLVIATR